MATFSSRKEYSAAAVVEAFKCNDHAVLSAVYKLNFPAVSHYILQNNGEEQDAKDIYQEAVLVLWQNIQSEKITADANTNIGGYLFQVAKHKWLDKLKSKQHRSTLRIVREESIETADTGTEENEELEGRLLQLRVLFARLGDTCKAILNKFYYEKKSLEEIGDDLNYDAATLRTKKYRCMMQLRKMSNES